MSRSFGTCQALKLISLDIREGEFFSPLGPSGCGKTTTLRIITGVELPDNWSNGCAAPSVLCAGGRTTHGRRITAHSCCWRVGASEMPCLSHHPLGAAIVWHNSFKSRCLRCRDVSAE
ncbi:ATP-binding cassette domain-containing protein [Paracoccus versutus]|uniref:ATP-binding cassette domain-containing protein n=1 Tax=Paracoccus versutus TaxID=34007 RepID=UPI002852EA6B|nr:ATP-binding cassette domain-containing protein [Paracoccus versutus]